MLGRNRYYDTSPQMREVRDTATRESHPYTDPRANYLTAERHREVRAEGAALARRPA